MALHTHSRKLKICGFVFSAFGLSIIFFNIYAVYEDVENVDGNVSKLK